MRLLIYCAGGFGREIVDSVRRINQAQHRWDEICFIDDDLAKGPLDYDLRVYTFEAARDQLDFDQCETIIANGEPTVRKAIWDKLVSNDVRLATIIDPTVVMAETATVGEGVVMMPFCTVSSSADLSDNVVLNNRAIVGHDVKLGEHTVISSMVNIGGASTVGEGSYIGMGTQIKEGTTIGKNVIIGMGSVVHRDIPDGVIALGNPARPMRENVDKVVFRDANKGVRRD